MADPQSGRPVVAPGAWRRLRRITGVGLLVATAVVASANAYLLASTADQISTRVDATPARPFAVVLGGHINRGQPSVELAQRLTSARDLYRAGKVERIVVSGAVHGAYHEPDVMLRWLQAQGIPQEAISVDVLGTRTMATMVRAAQVFDVRSAVVCTQAYHLPRSLFLARRAGIDAVGLAADGSPYARQTLREIMARTAVLFETALLGLRAEGLSRRS